MSTFTLISPITLAKKYLYLLPHRLTAFYSCSLLIASGGLWGCSSVGQDNGAVQPTTQAQLTAQFAQLTNQPLTTQQNLTYLKQPATLTTLDCDRLQSGNPITLTGSNQIPKDCDLWQKTTHFIIESDNVSLDCQGVAMSANDEKTTAITIRTPSNQAKGVQNIEIKNCAVSGYNHGVLIEQQTPANVRYQQLLAKKTTLNAQYQQSPQRILLNRLLVSDSKNSGIFIGDHVQQVTLANSQVNRSGTVGVYLEFGSRHNQILYSQFGGNGFREKATVAGIGIGKPNREAIAIDSSAHNVIAHNQFNGNGAGGVFLYRNCFEHANDPSRANHFLRTQGSNDNQILQNSFNNELVGVWVAARQSRNLKAFACGAYTIGDTLLSRYHLDESEQNQITRNQFSTVEKGIIIEDDQNIVSFNQFSQAVDTPISVGSAIRDKSSEGVVKGNQINDNIFVKPVAISQLIKMVGKSGEKNLHCNNFDAHHKKIDNVCLVR